MNVGESVTYNYSGGIQTFNVDNSGYYMLEVWGAQGGGARGRDDWQLFTGGYGGYAKGYIKLKKGDKLYVGVGGAGGTVNQWGGGDGAGYNGGGSGGGNWTGGYDACGGGGGATHIAKNSNRGTLPNYSSNQSEVLIVAGGGGSGYEEYQGEGDASSGYGGAGGSGGGGSFGQGAGRSTWYGAGGGGWSGGAGSNGPGGKGGTNGVSNVPAITISGTTYSPVSSSGQKGGNGQAKITFFKKAVSVYVGDTQADALYVGDNEVDTIYVGDNEA